MALDTVVLNLGSGGKSIGVDNISNVDYEVVKQAYGVEGALTLVSASNPLPVTNAAIPTTIFNGKTLVTTAGTRVVLASSQAIKSVTVKALSTNTGFIYVGDTSVSSTNGFQLSAGDSVSMDIANLNTVNIDSSVNGEGVTYFAVN